MVLGLSDQNKNNKLAKLYFRDEKCSKKLSLDLIEEKLNRLHTIREDLIVGFHKKSVRLYDHNLVCRHQVRWIDVLDVPVEEIGDCSIAPNHPDWDSTGFICAFEIDQIHQDKVPCKTVYDWKLANQSEWNKLDWIVRLKISEDGTKIVPYN